MSARGLDLMCSTHWHLGDVNTGTCWKPTESEFTCQLPACPRFRMPSALGHGAAMGAAQRSSLSLLESKSHSSCWHLPVRLLAGYEGRRISVVWLQIVGDSTSKSGPLLARPAGVNCELAAASCAAAASDGAQVSDFRATRGRPPIPREGVSSGRRRRRPGPRGRRRLTRRSRVESAP